MTARLDHGVTPDRGLDWRDRAACVGHDTETWFPLATANQHRVSVVVQAQTEQAKAICANCPVRQKCLDWALTTPEPWGIWGGLTEEERAAMRRPGLTQREAASARAAEEAQRRAARDEQVRMLAKQQIYSDREIAKQLGIGDETTVRRIRRRLGIPTRPRRLVWSAELVETVRRFAGQGMGDAEIGDLINRDKAHVQSCRRYYNIPSGRHQGRLSREEMTQ